KFDVAVAIVTDVRLFGNADHAQRPVAKPGELENGRRGQFLKPLVGGARQLKEIQKVRQAAADMCVRRLWSVRLRQAIAQDINRWVDLSPFPPVRNRPEHGKDIFHRREVIATITQDMNDSNDAPVL